MKTMKQLMLLGAIALIGGLLSSHFGGESPQVKCEAEGRIWRDVPEFRCVGK